MRKSALKGRRQPKEFKATKTRVESKTIRDVTSRFKLLQLPTSLLSLVCTFLCHDSFFALACTNVHLQRTSSLPTSSPLSLRLNLSCCTNTISLWRMRPKKVVVDTTARTTARTRTTTTARRTTTKNNKN